MRDPDFEPAYLRLLESGGLKRRADEAWDHLTACDLCPRRCRVDRHESASGECRVGERAIVSGFGPHHGEENPLRGRHGSGTVFFSGCNLRCVFCQNWETSQEVEGNAVAPEDLAAIWLRLQEWGCHNINLVSPSHVVAQVLAALVIAAEGGLRLPLVYNTGGYDSPEALALLDGVIDIYMPDMKYGDSETAERLSGIPGYWEVNRAAVKEMHRQVGNLVVDARGIARRGILVRHLVLPEDRASTERVLTFLAREVSTETYLNLMDQYRPCHLAGSHPPLDRPLRAQEFDRAATTAESLGLRRLDGRRRI